MPRRRKHSATPSARVDTVNSVTEDFSWAHRRLSTPDMKSRERTILGNLSRLSLSTAFSGVCAPSVSIHILREGLRYSGFSDRIGDSLDFEYRFAIEKSHECQLELSLLPTPPQCLVPTMEDLLTPTTKSIIRSFGPKPTLEQLASAVLGRPGALNLNVPCVFHKDDCTACKLTWSFLHVGGSPCTDFSSQGGRQGLAGPTTLSLVIWLGLIKELGFFCVIAENVKPFPTWMFEVYLPMYELSVCLLNNTQFATPVSRGRKYSVMTLKTTARLARPVSDLVSVFRSERGDAYTWRSLMLASRGELEAELAWATSRTGAASGGRQLSCDDPSAFEATLTAHEADHLSRFHSKIRGVAYSLSQDADTRFCWGREDILQTIFCGCHMLWSDVDRRWLTGRELLACQGFPVFDRCLDGVFGIDGQPRVAVCSFNSSRLKASLSSRSRPQLTSQAGNTMHVGVIGSVVLWALAYLELNTSERVPMAIPLSDDAVQASDAAQESRESQENSANSAVDFDATFNAFAAQKKRPRSAMPCILNSSSVALYARAPLCDISVLSNANQFIGAAESDVSRDLCGAATVVGCSGLAAPLSASDSDCISNSSSSMALSPSDDAFNDLFAQLSSRKRRLHR